MKLWPVRHFSWKHACIIEMLATIFQQFPRRNVSAENPFQDFFSLQTSRKTEAKTCEIN